MSADLWKLLTFIQDDLRGVQAKLVEVRSQLAALEIPREPKPAHVCRHCGVAKRTESLLVDHLANVHGFGLNKPNHG